MACVSDAQTQRSNPHFADDERLRPYLNSDNLPGEDIALEIHSLLERLSNQRQDIKKNMDVLNITLEALRRSYDDLDRVMFSYKSLLSPIRRLPDDVLGEIFLHTLPSKRNAFPIPSDLPLLLTLVSKRWDHIARATPRLWSKLHIVLPHSYTANDDVQEAARKRSYISAVKAWLCRSGDVPLSLSISSSDDRWSLEEPSPSTEDLLLFVIQQSSRWSELDLTCATNDMRFLNENLPTNIAGQPLPLLRRLRVHYYADPPEVSKPLYHYAAPSLKELSLDFSVVDNDSSLFTVIREEVNWSSLVQLSLHHYQGDCLWLLDILHRCPQLEHLLIDMSDYIGPSNHSPERMRDSFCIPKLKTFSLRGGNDDVYNICQYLETPLLTHFAFHPTYQQYPDFGGTDSEPLPKSPLRDFLARCSILQALTLSPAQIPEQNILAILETVPGIKTLVLDHLGHPFALEKRESGPSYRYPENRFRLGSFFTQGSDAARYSSTQISSLLPLLPNLQSFSLMSLSISPEAAELILSFCKSRLSRPLLGDAAADAHPPFALLNHIEMVASKLESTVDIGAHLHQYAESVGRTIGDDLVLDITYPWDPEYQWIPATVLDPQDGLRKETDRTWHSVDAGDYP